MTRLAREGLLASRRGVKGGYSLAHDPNDISVATMLTALEGPIAITECVDDAPGACSQEVGCRARGNWQRINDALRQTLESISLAEMAHPSPSVGWNDLIHIGGGEGRSLEERP